MRIGDQTVDLRAAISISYRRGCAAWCGSPCAQLQASEKESAC